MQQAKAERISIQALDWLSRDAELFGVFLGTTGLDVADISNVARDPAFLGSVLDFILMSDETVTSFCDASGLGYETPMQARGSLPGGEAVNWT